MLSISDITKNSLNYPFNGISKVIVTGLIYLLSCLFIVTSLTFLIPNFMGQLSINISENPIAVPSAMIGIILSFIVFLILVGYTYRVIENTILVDNKLPEYDNIFLMLIQGFKITLVEVLYQVIPVIILVVGVVLLRLATSNVIFSYASIILIVIAVILSLFLEFFSVMAVNNLIAYDGKLSKAFAIKEIWALIKSVGFFKFIGTIIVLILVQLVIYIGIGVLIAILSAISAISGPLALPLLIIISAIYLLAEAYFMIFMARGYGLLYIDAQ